MEASSIILGVGVCVASGFFAFHTLLNESLDLWLGAQEPHDDSPLAACLNEYVPGASCAASAMMYVSPWPPCEGVPVYTPEGIPVVPNCTFGGYSYDTY